MCVYVLQVHSNQQRTTCQKKRSEKKKKKNLRLNVSEFVMINEVTENNAVF